MAVRGQGAAGWTGALLAALLASACASTSTEKGGLVPLDVRPEALDAAHAPRRVALLIGVGRFDDPEWRKLRYPEKDAADLARVLADPQRGAFTHVETVREATRQGIRDALQRLVDGGGDERD